MITESLTLAFCSVVLRRFVDRITGHIPVLPAESGIHSNHLAIAMFGGAMYYLYKHLRKGSLVRIGHGHPKGNLSLKTMQKRSKNSSWFLRNVWGTRRNCTDAIYRLAKHSVESLSNLNPCLLLPHKNFQISFPKNRDTDSVDRSRSASVETNSSVPCDVIYSNKGLIRDQKLQPKTARDAKKSNLNLTANREIEKKPIQKAFGKRIKDKKLGSMSSSKGISKLNLELERRTRSGRVYSPPTKL